jgi:hypothetical protein
VPATFVRDPCAKRREMVVIRGRERSLKTTCVQDLFELPLSTELALGRSQRRSRQFESAHLHSWSLSQRFPWWNGENDVRSLGHLSFDSQTITGTYVGFVPILSVTQTGSSGISANDET